jgi:hypothetical protein
MLECPLGPVDCMAQRLHLWNTKGYVYHMSS